VPTHFDGDDGEPVAIETCVHRPSNHVRVIDDEWIEVRPQSEAHRGWPIRFAFAWHRSAECPR
jgi:hypothetical protein